MALFGLSFGANKSKNEAKKKFEQTTTATDQLEIEQAGIDNIIRKLLSQADGIASIFQGEQTSGIFNSSVAAQAAGDFAANVVGEIAELTAKRVTTEEIVGEEEQKGKGSGISLGFNVGGGQR